MKPDHRGAGMILCASVFVAGSTFCAKQLSIGEDALSPFQVTWGRYFFALLAITLLIAVLRPKFSKARWPLHGVRVTTGAAGVTLMFAATGYIPLADVTAISFTNPVFAMVFAILFLGEKIGPIRWGCAGIALFGAVLLIRPGATSFEPAALLALGAALLFGLEVIALKVLGRAESAIQIILIANVVGTLILSCFAPFVWQWPTSTQWFFLAATGLLMICAQGFYTNALKLGEASFVLPFSYATLLFAAFYDFAFFQVVPTWLSILGGTIIVISGIVLAWRDGMAARRV